MDDLWNKLRGNVFFWIVLAVTVIQVGAVFVGDFVVDKVADRVIEKLQKEYSPSPYGPGIDPDKVNPDAFRRSYHELKHHVSGVENIRQSEPVSWRDAWEQNRGFNP
jgi:hypothetical protein